MTSSRSSNDARRRMPHAVDLFVDRGFFFDVGVGARHISFRRVVIVVRHEIFDGVVGEEILELAIELGGERFIGREDQRRALGALDDVRHGIGLAGTGDAEQYLVALIGVGALHQFGDGRGLITLRFKLRDDLEQLPAFGFWRLRWLERYEARRIRQHANIRPQPFQPGADGVRQFRITFEFGLRRLSESALLSRMSHGRDIGGSSRERNPGC